eukprot:345957-Rhodomonas_salina.1
MRTGTEQRCSEVGGRRTGSRVRLERGAADWADQVERARHARRRAGLVLISCSRTVAACRVTRVWLVPPRRAGILAAFTSVSRVTVEGAWHRCLPRANERCVGWQCVVARRAFVAPSLTFPRPGSAWAARVPSLASVALVTYPPCAICVQAEPVPSSLDL